MVAQNRIGNHPNPGEHLHFPHEADKGLPLDFSQQKLVIDRSGDAVNIILSSGESWSF